MAYMRWYGALTAVWHGHIESLDSSGWVQSYTWGLPPKDRDNCEHSAQAGHHL